MLDNFRRRDLPQSTRGQSQYSRLQEALSAAGDESAKTEAFGIEAPKADLHGDPEPSRPGRESVSKLIVGPDIKLKGAEITDCDTLVVEGRVEASMDSRAIQISEHGVFVGKAGIDVAEIRGRFEGELTARKQLVIRATGRVSGKVRYGKVAIEEGGEISGDIAALQETQGTGVARAAGRSHAAAPAVPAQAQAGVQALPGKPAWTAQAGTQLGQRELVVVRQPGRAVTGAVELAVDVLLGERALFFGPRVAFGVLAEIREGRSLAVALGARAGDVGRVDRRHVVERGLCRRVALDVLVEGRPARRVLNGAKPGQRVIALDREFGDVLLDTHRELENLADDGHRQAGDLLRQFANPLGGGYGEARGNPEREREWLHAYSLPYVGRPAQPNGYVGRIDVTVRARAAPVPLGHECSESRNRDSRHAGHRAW